ncbi:hypothetical protein B7463_g11853, partial [Scytalidium lignicola]
MSEVQKPVEEPSATAPAAKIPAAEVPNDMSAATTDVAAAAVTTDTPAEQLKEEPTREKAKEVTPATDGVLGYKAPGLVKSLRFSKRYFYFSEKPVESKQLLVFLQNEKPAVAHPIAAWASQTGKGLLFFTKPAPTNIFNLADITDITKEGSTEFLFKVNGQKHTFQASSSVERDSWLAALEAKSTEAKAEKEIVTSSEGYKVELEKLSKPTIAEAAPKRSSDTKETVRRASIFGTFFGKKEEMEKEEAKKDKPEEFKPAEAATVPTAKSAAAVEAPAETSSEPAEKKEEKEASAPTETTAISSTAPQLENPVEESTAKPIDPESVIAPVEAEALKDATTPAETQAVRSEEKETAEAESEPSPEDDKPAEETSKANEASAAVTDGPTEPTNVSTTSTEERGVEDVMNIATENKSD